MSSPISTLSRGLGAELVQEGLREAALLELQVLELARVHEAPRPVVAEDELVLLHDLAAGRGLGRGEAVADHLEDEVVGREGEDHHHHPPLPGRDLEVVVRGLGVGEEGAVELRLAVLVVADRVVELGDGLARHERAEEGDELARSVGVDEEVRAREAEDDRDLVLGQEHGVRRDPAARVGEGDHDRVAAPAPAPRAPDDVGALVAEEERAGGLEGLDRGGVLRVELARDEGGVAAQVLVAAAEAVVVEKPGHEAGGVLPAPADPDDRVEAGGQRLRGGGVHELDRGVDALGREHAAGDGVEERLRQVHVRPPGKAARVDLVGRPPQGPLVEAVPQPPPQAIEGLGQAGAVEVEALGRVPLHREPVPGLEVRPCPRRERPEALAVRLEGVPDDGRPVGRRVHGGIVRRPRAKGNRKRSRL